MDATFLQETKATRNWAATLEQRYARGWGLRAEQAETPLSWWTSTKRASGGVAVLFHPDSPFRQLTPCWPELWGPHCLGLHGQVDGCEHALVCIYAPVDRAPREALFSALSDRPGRSSLAATSTVPWTLRLTVVTPRETLMTHHGSLISSTAGPW
jgi:hypothetical protein